MGRVQELVSTLSGGPLLHAQGGFSILWSSWPLLSVLFIYLFFSSSRFLWTSWRRSSSTFLILKWSAFAGWCAASGKKWPTASLCGGSDADGRGTTCTTPPKHPPTGDCFTSCARREGIWSRIQEGTVRCSFPSLFLSSTQTKLCSHLVSVDEMKFWEITANGGDRWTAEGLLFPHPNETIQNNFVTSYEWVKDGPLLSDYPSKLCHGYASSDICKPFWCLQKMHEVSTHRFG